MITVEGESARKWFDLGTDSKPLARRKMARLLKEQNAAIAPTVEQLTELAARVESVGQAFKRITERQKAAKD
jgi:hypothetical protein